MLTIACLPGLAKHAGKPAVILFAGLFFSFQALHAQSCIQAGWVKSYGLIGSNAMVVDVSRTADGHFVLLGSYGNAPLLLDTITLPGMPGTPYYLALQDSSGNILQAAVVMSGAISPAKINIDSDGSVLITGYFTGGMIGADTLPNTSRQRFFAAKFNAAFQLQWKKLSDWMSADCKGFDITTDLDNNVFVVGAYEDNAFKIGDFVCENFGGWNSWSDDAFIMKMDANGAIQWLHTIGSAQDEAARTVTADSSGNVFVTGVTTQSNSVLYFDEQHAITKGEGNMTMFYARYSGLDGHCLWGRVAGEFYSPTRLYPYDAALGADETVYVCGEIAGMVFLEPRTASSADNGGFLAKLTPQGACEWIKVIGGQGSSELANAVAYYQGRVAVAGKLFSNQPYVDDFPLYSTQTGGSFDAFNAQFGEDGHLLWARGNNSSSNTGFYPQGIAIDNSGQQLLWGSYLGTQNWYPLSLTNSSSMLKTFVVRFQAFTQGAAFTVTAGPDKSSLCGVNVALSGSTSPSNIAFGWFPDLGFSNNGSKTPNAPTAAPGTYILFAAYQGCVQSDTVQVQLTNYGLTLNVSPDLEFCQGDSVQMQVVCNEPTATYSWLPASYINTATSANPWVKPPVTANYIVTAEHNACKIKDTVIVYSRPKPFIALPRQDYYMYWRYHLCQGSFLDFDMGDPANTYTITTPDLVSSVNNNLATLLGDSLGTAFLKAQAVSPHGCASKDSTLLVVHQNQAAPVILGSIPNRSACPGDSLEIPIWLTNSLQYNFQYSWYAGWQIDSMNGQGWKDISIWDKNYEVFNYSVGYPTSTYYSELRIANVTPGMDGFRYRCSVHDYCSPTTYSNTGTLSVGPKITQHPVNKTLCSGVTDSISVNSSSPNTQYQWEVFQGGNFVPVVPLPGVIVPNGRFLRFENVQAALDSSIFRCRTEGCGVSAFSYSNPAMINVVVPPQVLWQSGDDSLCEGAVDSFMVVTNTGPYTYNWYENNTALTYNTSQMCCFNTNKLKFTPVYLQQNNYTYKLRIRNTQCNYETYSSPVRFYVLPSAPVTWPGGNVTLCDNNPPLVLSGASPAGGTYSGNGVTSGVFDPQAAGLGNHWIYYNLDTSLTGCGGSAFRVFVVNEAPVVSWDDDTIHLCQGDPPYPLSGGLPSGGTYSGTGVMNASFYSVLSGPGNFLIKYKKRNIQNGCADSSMRVVTVHPKPQVSWPGGSVSLCQSWGPQMLTGGIPAGGQYSGNAVSAGIFMPALAGLGWHTLTYTYIDLLSGCQDSSSRQFWVDPCTGIAADGPGQVLVYQQQGSLFFQMDTEGGVPIQVEMLDVYGQVIVNEEFNLPCLPCRLSVSQLKPGVYFIRFSGKNMRLTRKLLLL